MEPLEEFLLLYKVYCKKFTIIFRKVIHLKIVILNILVE
jgi:hypothetical protein